MSQVVFILVVTVPSRDSRRLTVQWPTGGGSFMRVTVTVAVLGRAGPGAHTSIKHNHDAASGMIHDPSPRMRLSGPRAGRGPT